MSYSNLNDAFNINNHFINNFKPIGNYDPSDMEFNAINNMNNLNSIPYISQNSYQNIKPNYITRSENQPIQLNSEENSLNGTDLITYKKPKAIKIDKLNANSQLKLYNKENNSNSNLNPNQYSNQYQNQNQYQIQPYQNLNQNPNQNDLIQSTIRTYLEDAERKNLNNKIDKVDKLLDNIQNQLNQNQINQNQLNQNQIQNLNQNSNPYKIELNGINLCIIILIIVIIIDIIIRLLLK